MSVLSQIGTSDPQRNTLNRATTVDNLVAALRESEQALRDVIRAEEERTCLSDPNDPCYSMVAQSLRARADNLRMTIATLESARQAA
ncbi:MAG TPA: hypothetical protein VLR92_07115 [Blastocatellia bacterium]|nr:hypothetical protein [Blastocatellia bacterium]